MDQNTKLFQQAKQLLNENKNEPFTDSEIREIVSLLDVFANMIYQNQN